MNNKNSDIKNYYKGKNEKVGRKKQNKGNENT